jgi:glucose-1-phosphate thymidylyltransferase
MRRAEAGVTLDPAQASAADQGVKAMMPVGRPLLDYILSGLAEAGITKVCLVIGPEHTAIQEYYRSEARPTRLSLTFAVQQEPRGTADAVLAAEEFAGGEPVLVQNGDNYYPIGALAALAALPRAGLVGFRQSSLVADGGIPPERVMAFALIAADQGGHLTRIIEKPTPEEASTFGPDPLVSMNAWLLPPTIYAACRAVRPSPRGELELQNAVRLAMDQHGEQFRVVESSEAVLDLSTRADIPRMAARLAGVEVQL